MNFSTDQVINLLSDADSRNILNLIVSDTTDTGVTLHLTKTNLTRKQYYYRLGELITLWHYKKDKWQIFSINVWENDLRHMV